VRKNAAWFIRSTGMALRCCTTAGPPAAALETAARGGVCHVSGSKNLSDVNAEGDLREQQCQYK
jgi:hypothetical protein